jgi:hypothetical protein
MQLMRPGVRRPAARPKAAARHAGVEAGGRPLLRAVQRGPALQPAPTCAYPRADLCQAGSGA